MKGRSTIHIVRIQSFYFYVASTTPTGLGIGIVRYIMSLSDTRQVEIYRVRVLVHHIHFLMDGLPIYGPFLR